MINRMIERIIKANHHDGGMRALNIGPLRIMTPLITNEIRQEQFENKVTDDLSLQCGKNTCRLVNVKLFPEGSTPVGGVIIRCAGGEDCFIAQVAQQESEVPV